MLSQEIWTKKLLLSQETLTKTLLLLNQQPPIKEMDNVKKCLVLIALIFLIFSAILLHAGVKAESKTIVVPDDYPTITSAVGNATSGDTILVKSGTYQDNAIYANKILTIVGEGSQNTIVNLKSHSFEIVLDVLGHKATFYDHAVNITANNFSLSKLTINSNGGDIIISGDKTQITDSSITPVFTVSGNYLDIERNFFSKDSSITGSYATIRGNTFENSINYNGISFAGQYDMITGNAVTGSGVYISTAFSYVAHNTFSGAVGSFFILSGSSNTIDDNTIGHFSYGLAARGSNNTILKNTITHCAEGLLPMANNTCYANYIANNVWGLDTGGMSAHGNPMSPNGDGSLNGSQLYDNNFVDNTYQVNTLFPAKTAYFDNGKEGNYWSNYQGKDLNGDGIGDTPYVIDANRSDRYPLIAPFNISNVPDLIPDWASAPVVQLINPTKTTYLTGNISLDFAVNKQTEWIGYSLDGQNNITIQENTTLTNLSRGTHNITVYSGDLYHNTGLSEIINFTVADSSSSFIETFPTATVAVASGVSAIAVVAGLFVYFKKRKSKVES